MSDETIQYDCPACGSRSLFIGAGGYLTCSRLDCPQPIFYMAMEQKIREERIDESKTHSLIASGSTSKKALLDAFSRRRAELLQPDEETA